MLNAGLAAAGDEADLGVDLIVLKSVDDLAARLLQPLGPVDVVLLVEPGPQLDEHGDILAVFRRGAQVVHQLGPAGQAVDGDADGEHIRVLCRLPQQRQEGVHALIGVGQQRVLLQHLGQQRPVRVQHGGPLRGKGRVR